MKRRQKIIFYLFIFLLAFCHSGAAFSEWWDNDMDAGYPEDSSFDDVKTNCQITHNLGVKKSRFPDSLEMFQKFPGFISVKLDTQMQVKKFDEVLEGHTEFDIVRSARECFYPFENGQHCTRRIRCQIDEENSTVNCPLAIYDPDIQNYKVLIEDEADEFQIQAILVYHRSLTHSEMREVIEKSALLSLDKLKFCQEFN